MAKEAGAVEGTDNLALQRANPFPVLPQNSLEVPRLDLMPSQANPVHRLRPPNVDSHSICPLQFHTAAKQAQQPTVKVGVSYTKKLCARQMPRFPWSLRTAQIPYA